VEYDAYRVDVESKQCSTETQRLYEQHRLKFEQLRQVLDIKLQLLDENRVCAPRRTVTTVSLLLYSLCC